MKKLMLIATVAFAVACNNNDNKPITAPNSDSAGQHKTDTMVNSSSGTLNTDTVGMAHRKAMDSAIKK